MCSNGFLKWLMILVVVLVLFVVIWLFLGGSILVLLIVDVGVKFMLVEMKVLGIEGDILCDIVVMFVV